MHMYTAYLSPCELFGIKRKTSAIYFLFAAFLHISSQSTNAPHPRPSSDCSRLRFDVLLDLVHVINCTVYCIVYLIFIHHSYCLQLNSILHFNYNEVKCTPYYLCKVPVLAHVLKRVVLALVLVISVLVLVLCCT